MPEDLIKVINKMNTFTNKIRINHFDSDHYTAQEDHFGNTQQDDDQEYCDDMNNSEHEYYNKLDDSQQIDGMGSDIRCC